MFLGPLLLSDIGLNYQDVIGLALLILYQCPTRFDNKGFLIFRFAPDLTLPFTSLFKFRPNIIKRFSVAAKENVGNVSTEDVLKAPAIDPFSAFVPVQDVVPEVADQDRILRVI